MPYEPDSLASLWEQSRRGDLAAREKLLKEGMKMVRAIASRGTYSGEDREDIFQVGCIGLVKAMAAYQPDKGAKFSTFAFLKIDGEIKMYRRQNSILKMSRSLLDQARQINNARHALRSRLGREPTIKELTAETGIEEAQLVWAQEAASVPLPVTEDVIDSNSFSPESVLDSYALQETLARLPERQRKIIAWRYYRGLSQEQTARDLGISQTHISRLEKRALLALRQLMSEGKTKTPY